MEPVARTNESVRTQCLWKQCSITPLPDTVTLATEQRREIAGIASAQPPRLRRHPASRPHERPVPDRLPCVRHRERGGVLMSKYDQCIIPGCQGKGITRQMCPKHYQRWRLNGNPLITKIAAPRPSGAGAYTAGGYHVRVIAGRRVYEHVRIAEAALGRPLPKKAHVHHVDENPANNDPSNLVICPDARYHRLLHIRANALRACGRADWRGCRLCKQYDDPANMYYRPKTADHVHRACRDEVKAKWRERRRAQGLRAT